MSRVAFLFDGFNIYHALNNNRRHPEYRRYKWLDYSKLASRFVTSQDQIVKVLLFTSYAHWMPDKEKRHRTLIRAQEASGVEVVLGSFRHRDRYCPNCRTWFKAPVEKETDVNLALHLFHLAHMDAFDKAVVATGDSDAVPAIRMVRKAFPAKRVGVLIPIGRRNEELKNASDFAYKMKEKHLRTSQFPNVILLGKGAELRRPSKWY